MKRAERWWCLYFLTQCFLTFGVLDTHAMDSAWEAIPNTQMREVCPPNRSDYLFHDRCNNVLQAWGGGTLDTLRNRLVIWGEVTIITMAMKSMS